MTTKFTNCRLVKNGSIISDNLWIRNGKIINPEPVFYKEKTIPDTVVDCNNALICPGFIDVQINGGYGYDFSSDISEIDEAIKVFRKRILSTGVTAFCPTLVTSPKSIYHEVLQHLKRRSGNKEGAEILGVHLEGPFISPLKKGAHPIEHIVPLEKGIETVYDTYGNLEDVSLITIAPELENASQVIKSLTEQGIFVSIGHSTANLLDGEEAARNGATSITHLFNAMASFHHRDPGLVGLLTSQFIPKPIFYGIIADGIHTHPAALRIAQRTHPKGLVVVTDAMAALGLGDGFHKIGQHEVEVEGRRAYLKGTDTLAGSIATMDDCIRHLIKETGVGIVEGIEAATLHPAQLLKLEHKKGTLNYGADGDFVLIDDTKITNKESLHDFTVLHTFINGELVYSSPSTPTLVFES